MTSMGGFGRRALAQGREERKVGEGCEDRGTPLDAVAQGVTRRIALARDDELTAVLESCGKHVAEHFGADQLQLLLVEDNLGTSRTLWRWPNAEPPALVNSLADDTFLLDLARRGVCVANWSVQTRVSDKQPDSAAGSELHGGACGDSLRSGDETRRVEAFFRNDGEVGTHVFAFRISRDGDDDEVPKVEDSVDSSVLDSGSSILESLLGALGRIEQSKAAAEEARWSQIVLERSSDYVCVLSESGCISFVSGSIAVDGYNPRELLGKMIWELVHEDDHHAARSIVSATGSHTVVRMRRADGTWRYVEVRAKNLTNDPSVNGIVINGRDVTERVSLERDIAANSHAQKVLTEVMARLCATMPGQVMNELRHALGVLAALVGSSKVTLYWPRSDGRAVPMMCVTPKGTILHVEDMVPITLPSVNSPLVIERSTDEHHPLIAAVRVQSLPPLGMLVGLPVLGPSGDPGLLTFGHGSPDYDADDAVLRILPAFAQVVSATVLRNDAESRLNVEATVDPVTGLSNRAVMRRTLTDAMRNLKQLDVTVSLLLLDLDDFKMVNDGYGHHVGDALLAQLGHRLRAACAVDDVVARLGGDEFVIIAMGPAERGAELADAVHAALKLPFVVESLPLSVTGSIGVATVGPTDAALEPGDLLRRADIAMYRAKNRDLGDTEFFDDEMGESAQGTAQIRLELEHGIDTNEIEVWLQPIVDVVAGEHVGAEALVRWRHPARGLMFPDSFVPVAERSGLIGTLGMLVLREAVAALAKALDDDASISSDFYVSVNVAAPQLRDPTFPATVIDLLRERGITPNRLRLEVTESQLVERSLLAPLQLLRDNGVRIGIDDFGTGYSSLAALQTLPVDVLKIDKCFIERIHLDAQARTLTAAVIAMANSLGLETVAEGVEFEEQAATLAELLCRSAQGYWYGHPLPLTQWLQERRQIPTLAHVKS